MTRKSILVWGLVILAGLCIAEDDNPGKMLCRFSFGSIPFGKSEKEIVPFLKGLEVQSETNPEFSGYESLKEYFPKGLFIASGKEETTYLQPDCVRRVSVRYPPSEAFSHVILYFLKNPVNPESESLFLVRKLPRKQDSDMETTFNTLMAAINAQIKSKAQILRTSYMCRYVPDQISYEMADMAVWMHGAQKVFLFVPMRIGQAGTPEILYVQNNGLKDYLKCCETFKEDKTDPKDKPVTNDSNFF